MNQVERIFVITAAIFVPLAFLLGAWNEHGPFSGEVASWAQAGGGVLAIIAAINIARSGDLVRARNDAIRQRQLVKAAGMAITEAQATVRAATTLFCDPAYYASLVQRGGVAVSMEDAVALLNDFPAAEVIDHRITMLVRRVRMKLRACILASPIALAEIRATNALSTEEQDWWRGRLAEMEVLRQEYITIWPTFE